MRNLIRRSQIKLLAAVAGGSLFVLDGCDPTARDTVLTGVEGAATGILTTFVQAFFETLQADIETDGAATVKVIAETVTQFVC